MERFVCLHGHFYQVAKESFWLESVGNRVFHENNECVTTEDLHDASSGSREYDRRIAKMINNYASIGFNFGPTLLAWMEKHAGGTYAAILEADRQSMELRSGHGAALAQVYNNIIQGYVKVRRL